MADINEILSKEAIEGLKQADKLLTQADLTAKKFIETSKQLDASFRAMSASQQNIVSGQKQMQAQTEKMTQLQKDEAKAVKATESAAAALNKQRQTALSQLAKQEAKERELAEALKKEVKTLQDAATQNRALTQARKNLDLTTEKGRATLRQYNDTITKNTEFIRQNATAMEKQRMNIGNYKSAFDGVGAKLAGAFSVTAVLAFGRAAFAAFEEQEQANRKLLFALKGNKQAFKELTDQANEFQSKTGIADDAIQGIQVLAAESGKTTAEIKKITEATINWSKITGQDLQAAYLQINGTLTGTAGRLTRVDAEFKTLTEEQLKAGAAIDLINTKYKGFAENAATDTEKLTANWNEFKESAGSAIGGIINPLLKQTSSLLNDINTKQGFWQKTLTLFSSLVPSSQLKNSFDAVNLAKEKNNKLDSVGIRNAESTKKIIAETVKARMEESAAITAKQNKDKQSKIIIEQVGAYQKLTQSISDTREQINNLLAAGQQPSTALSEKLQKDEEQLIAVGKAAEFAALRLIAVQQGGFEPTLTGKGTKAATPAGRKLTPREGITGGSPIEGTELFASGEASQFALDQAQVVADTTFQIMADSANAEFDLKLSLLEKEKQARLDVAKTEEEKAKIEAKYAKQAAKIKTEQFKKQKSADIIQAIINTALAVTRLLATPAAAIAAGIAGAAQVAVISAQKVPQFDAGSASTPSQFIAGERRPEFMITPSGGVQLVTRPTMFKNMAGATVIGGEETAEIMKATGANGTTENLAPYISRMESNIVAAITNKRELHISATGSRITERQGEYFKTYFNRKVSWVGRKN